MGRMIHEYEKLISDTMIY